MNRKILSVALLVSLLMGTLWQTMTPTLQAAKTTAQWKTQKTGSAGVLIGKSVLVSIFVEDADSKWNEKQKKGCQSETQSGSSIYPTTGEEV